MPITVACGNCGKGYKVDEKLVGQRVKCKQCGEAFVIEAPPPPDIDPFAEGAFDAAPPAEEKPVQTGKKLYNPIDSGSLSSAAAKPPSPSPATGEFLSAAYAPRRGRTNIKLIWLVLAAFLVTSIIVAISLTISAYGQIKDTRAATNVSLHIWGWIILFDALLFALLGPAMWLGIWGASKVIYFSTDASAYARACAVTAIAAIIACLAGFSPDLLKIVLFVLLLPAVYYALKIFFDYDWSESGIALAFGVGGLLLAGLIARLILGLVMPGSIFSAVGTARDLALASANSNPTDDSSWNMNSPGDSTPPLPASQDPAAYEKFKEDVQTRTSADISKSTREERMPDVLDLKRQAASLYKAFHNEPDWNDTIRKIELFEQRVNALPSGKFDNSIFTQSPDAQEWTTGSLSRGRLGPEVTVGSIIFQPPVEMKLDLASSLDSATGLLWRGTTRGDASLAIAFLPRDNEKQLKPAVTDKEAVLRTSRASGLLAVDGTNTTTTEGQFDGTPVTRLIANTGDHVTTYYVPEGNRWAVITVHGSSDPKFARIVNASARTLREMQKGDTAHDVFAPPVIAQRLADSYDQAAAILKKAGRAGEDAVDAILNSTDPALRQAALRYVTENGTVRSMTALRELLASTDAGVADAAQAAITRLRAAPGPAHAATAPANSSLPTAPPATPNPAAPGPAPAPPVVTKPANALDMRFILTNLKRTNSPETLRASVRQLATITPDEQYRKGVSKTLAEMLAKGDSGVAANEIATALSLWGDSTVGAKLAPLLKEDADPELRHAALTVLGNLKDAASAPAIAKLLKADAGPAESALIAIGPAAEPAVISTLHDVDSLVRIEAARILERIGTLKSLAELTRAARDPKDPAAQQAAQLAIESIKARSGDEAGATKRP